MTARKFLERFCCEVGRQLREVARVLDVDARLKGQLGLNGDLLGMSAHNVRILEGGPTHHDSLVLSQRLGRNSLADDTGQVRLAQMVNDETSLRSSGIRRSLYLVHTVQDVLQRLDTEAPGVYGEVEAVAALDQVAERVGKLLGEDGVVAGLGDWRKVLQKVAEPSEACFCSFR